MVQDDPEERVAELERRLAEPRWPAQPEPRQDGAVQRPGLTAEDVSKVAFADAAAGERGYDHDEVDAFLESVEAALQGQPGRTLTPEQVRSIAFSGPRRGRRGYAAADVDEFLDRVEIALGRASGQPPVVYPGAGGSQNYAATTPVPEPADSEDSGWIMAIVGGLVYVVLEMVTPNYGRRRTPNWVIPAWGVILVGLCLVTGKVGAALWVGIAFLVVSAIYMGFTLVRKLVGTRRPLDDQSPPGRHSAA